MLIDNLLMQGFSENRKTQNRKWKIWSTSFNPLSGRREYLITYSKTNTSKFPKRESFSEALVVKFNSGKSVDKVQLWSRFKEQHGNGGIRYHCVLKVAENKKCKSLKENISKKHNITLHFSDNIISTLVHTNIYAKKTLRLHTVKIVLIFLMQNPLERKNLSLKAELPGP